MKKIIILLCIILSFVCSAALLVACGDNNPPDDVSDDPGNIDPGNIPDPGKTVDSVTVRIMPTKTEYFIGEAFSIDGGVIAVKYTDNTSSDVPMTDKNVEITAPSTSRMGSKTVTVKYGGKKTTFKVNVVEKGLTVSFFLNYDNAPSPIEQNVVDGYTAAEPETPTRSGYTFYDWYVDKACTVTYDFDTIIRENTIVYAKWKENGATYFTVSYDLNFYGSAHPSYDQIVKSGETPVMLGLNPARTDYSFDSWTADADGNTAFDITAPITANTTVYAKWTKSKTTVSTYVFEAEDVDLSQKSGPGYSGENAGRGMVVTNGGIEASGNRFVAYQCKNGNSLEFYVACDEDVSDAILTVRFAAEYSSMTLSEDNYRISVNDDPVSYRDITLTLPDGVNQSNFRDFEVGKVTLKKGKNLIQLKTTNNDTLGGTLTATAPIIDCIKITTEAVVIWDGNYGLPQPNY